MHAQCASLPGLQVGRYGVVKSSIRKEAQGGQPTGGSSSSSSAGPPSPGSPLSSEDAASVSDG